MSYTHGWEWAHNQNVIGRTYQWPVMNWQGDRIACAHAWEAQSRSFSTGSETVEGDRFVHPWEAYAISTPADMTPLWFPPDFKALKWMAYDNDPLDFMTWKNMTTRDRSHKTVAQKPQWYTIKDELDDEFYLYPRPSIIWNNVENSAAEGAVHHTDFATESGETGAIIDGTYAESNQDAGIVTDYLRTDDNVTLIYQQRPTDINSDRENPTLPRYLQKYIEHGVLANAYTANTDGKIKSLADYWQWRKSLDQQVLNKFKAKRLADRDYRLTSFEGVPRTRRGPRLPSAYPAV